MADLQEVIGRVIQSQSIALRPNYFYDCYFILERTLGHEDFTNPEVNLFLKFFRIKPSGKLYNDMRVIANNSYSIDAWLDLIFSCPSGKKYLRRKDNRDKYNVQDLKPLEEKIRSRVVMLLYL